jgi:hypothetical protein
MSGCGCQDGHDCGCHGTGMHGYFLGALTPDQAAEQVIPSTKTGWWAMIRAGTLRDVQAGQLLDASGAPQYVPGTGACAASGRGAASVALADISAGGGLFVTAAPFIAAAGPAAPFVAAGAAIVGLFSKLLNHHAQAVKKEQSILCSATPAANNYLQIIDQAVHSGQVDPQHGIDALNSLLSDFESAVAPIKQGNDPAGAYGSCNAACIAVAQLKAIVAYKQSEYQDLIAGAAQTIAPSRPNTVAPSGVAAPASSYASFYSGQSQPMTATAPGASGDWLPVTALLIAGFFLARSL